MMVRRWGRIVNIASPSGIREPQDRPTTPLPKGLIGLTRSLARDRARGAGQRRGPGLIGADMTNQMNEGAKNSRLVSLRRMGTSAKWRPRCFLARAGKLYYRASHRRRRAILIMGAGSRKIGG
jgi:NAD(P)-dependent dehydrogenase (short-subunit alcohol dehydrogenase family)